MSSAPSAQIDELLTNHINHASRLQKDLLSNLSNKFHHAATSSFAYSPVMVPAIQQPALIGSGNFFDFHNIFKNRDAVGLPVVPKQEIDYESKFKRFGINGFSPKVSFINSGVPRSSFDFASIFKNHFDRGIVSLNPFDGTTFVKRKPTVRTPRFLTTPVMNKMEPNPDSTEDLETSAEIPEDEIDTSVDIFKPVVVAPNRNSTNTIPRKRTNYNPETGERIDNSVEIFRPVTKNTVPTTIYNDKLTRDPKGAELLNEN